MSNIWSQIVSRAGVVCATVDSVVFHTWHDFYQSRSRVSIRDI